MGCLQVAMCQKEINLSLKRKNILSRFIQMAKRTKDFMALPIQLESKNQVLQFLPEEQLVILKLGMSHFIQQYD